jgi:hypothetical protein
VRLTRLVLVLALALAPVLCLTGCSRAEAAESLPSVKLGMSPRDVRDRFEPSTEGSWQTRLGSGPGDDTTLEWVARDTSTARITTAKFEFHLGMLVAVRAHLREPASAETIDVTARTVSARIPAAAGSDLVILARDCPTHRDEAETVASRSTKPRR